MIPDAECVKIVSEILTDLSLGDFTIKVRILCYGDDFFPQTLYTVNYQRESVKFSSFFTKINIRNLYRI